MSDEGNSRNVIVTDIHMPFLSMVIFMVKGALASHSRGHYSHGDCIPRVENSPGCRLKNGCTPRSAFNIKVEFIER